MIIFLLGIQTKEVLAFKKTGEICDTLGSLAADPMHKDIPVEFENSDTLILINACLSAINFSNEPESLDRYHIQLGRGYLKVGDVESALSSFKISAE